ncbi:MAG TPA: HAMP domain-containing sensor histidine kinase [Kofleriaceae bacterium]|jgi:signal transduction histidine kinase|nr:HAMP domain-containing sensor histidine kinase [Kofleriaceae bacterium]
MPVDRDRIEERTEDALRRAVAARDEALAIVSHDLRNPLSAVQLSTRLLGELGLDERARKHVEMIQRAARSMSRLIEDLLDTVAIEAGRLALDVRPELVTALLGAVSERNEPAARDRGVALRATCDVPDVAIRADRARVIQVFGNLIGTLLTFCRAGDAVTISCQVDGDAVEFAISDTGPGIDPGLVPHLFEPYWTAPPNVRRRLGLGLYIARGIVDHHGGRIRVEARPGAAFVFTLPRAR